MLNLNIKKNHPALFFIFFFILIALPAAKAFQSYQDDYNKFSLHLPNENWVFDNMHSGKNPLKVKITYKQSIDQFIPNITLTMQPLQNKDTQQELANLRMQYQKNFSNLSEKKIKFGFYQVYDFYFEENQNSLRFWQRIIFHEDKVLILTYTAKLVHFERFLSDAKAIFESLTLLKELKNV